MDLDRDRRLSVREIRGCGCSSLVAGHCNGDGHVRSDEIPHHDRARSIGRGQVTGVGIPAFAAARMASSPASRAVPAWNHVLVSQDGHRTGDGDISRREFLGPRATLQRLDANHDGLIDAEEAVEPSARSRQRPTVSGPNAAATVRSGPGRIDRRRRSIRRSGRNELGARKCQETDSKK